MPRSVRSLALAALLVVALGLRLWMQSHASPLDDAYITYRYARNLAAGDGFVYNRGERVLGTTTPLFTLLLVPVARAGLALDTTAKLLGAIADVLLCALLWQLLRKHHRTSTGWLAAVFYATFYAALLACGYGMETQWFMLLVVLAFAAAVAGRFTAAAAAAAAATLTRPEGLLATGILAVMVARGVWRRESKLPWRALVLYLAIVGSWVLFASLYFGQPIPNSVMAKAAMRWMGPSHWLQFFFLRNPVVLLLWVGWAVGCVLALRSRNPVLLLFAVWGAVYVLFFLVGRPAFLAAWYFPPLVLSLLVLSAAAADAVAARLIGGGARRLSLVMGLWLAAMALLLPRALESARSTSIAAQRVYHPLAAWVRDHAGPDDTVFAGDVGYLGYFSHRRILDSAGLVSPEVWRYFDDHPAEPLPDIHFVQQRRPHLVVLSMGYGAYGHWNRREFLELYRPQRRFSIAGDTDLWPREDPARAYEKNRGRIVADYIVYEQRPDAR